MIPSSASPASERLVECELSVESVRSESVSSDSEFVGKLLLLLLLYPDVEATHVETIKVIGDGDDDDNNNIFIKTKQQLK